MEPITATLTTAKEIYEAAKTIQKVYNVSKEMKTVAESEGKDQIMATKDFAGTAANLKHEAKSEKGESSDKELKIEKDLYQDNNESLLPKGDFVDKLQPTHIGAKHASDTASFVERLPQEEASKELQNHQDIYVDRLPSSEHRDAGDEIRGIIRNELTNNNLELVSLDTNDATDSIVVGNAELNETSTSHLDKHTMDKISNLVDSMDYDLDSEKLKKYDFDSLRTISTRNEGLEGQNHPETGVPYERKVVEMDNGEKVEGVFPQFESKLDVQLPEELEQASDNKQFAECNRQLKEKCENDPEFRSQFTEDQLDDIEHGQTPEGYTWHHSEEKGKMQLVDYDTHMRTGHTGGRNIWGGGTENRH